MNDGELVKLGFPLIILGDPGMGKTELMGTLAQQLGMERISAGAFVRNSNPGKLPRPPIVIDGLDELAASTGASAVDEVLKKLSALNAPLFVLSCRAADWQGSADRQKILEDYGTAAVTAQLEPLSRNDATLILSDWDGVDPQKLLKALSFFASLSLEGAFASSSPDGMIYPSLLPSILPAVFLQGSATKPIDDRRGDSGGQTPTNSVTPLH